MKQSLIVAVAMLLAGMVVAAVMADAWEEQNTRRLIAETALELCEEQREEDSEKKDEAETGRLVIEGA